MGWNTPLPVDRVQSFTYVYFQIHFHRMAKHHGVMMANADFLVALAVSNRKSVMKKEYLFCSIKHQFRQRACYLSLLKHVCEKPKYMRRVALDCYVTLQSGNFSPSWGDSWGDVISHLCALWRVHSS